MTAQARREFLMFLLASPCLAGALASSTAGAAGTEVDPDVIGTAAGAFDLMDFEAAARRAVNPGHWAYLSSGVDDDGTLKANREVFSHVQLRPRRLRDATAVDMRTRLFGVEYSSPLFLSPIGGERSFHPDGELAVARAARARNAPQCLSTMTSVSVEEVAAARGVPVWQQLYAPDSWDVCTAMLRRVQATGCEVLVLTVDNTTGRNSETFLRTRPRDVTQCSACHEGPGGPSIKQRSMFAGIDMTGVHIPNPAMDWAFVDRLRKFWKGKLLIKGVDTQEDARLCIEHGVDAIFVSNHGGRATETLRPTLQALPEVVAAARGRVPVLVDGGFRRGTDVFKALALGATAVGIGRPFMWGLGAFGEAGVERVLEILQGELKLAMGNCGTRTPKDITPSYVITPDWKV